MAKLIWIKPIKNIDLLIRFNNSNNNFFGYTPDRFTSPEMRHEFNNKLIGFKQKIVLIDSFTGDLIQKLNKNIINNIMFLHSPTVTLNSMNYLPVYLNKVYQIGRIEEHTVYNGIRFTKECRYI